MSSFGIIDLVSTSRILSFWSPTYASDAAPLTSTTKQAKVVATVKAEGLPFEWVMPEPADNATVDLIRQTHTRAFVKAVLTGRKRRLAESQGFDWSPEFARGVVDAFAGQVQACQTALEHETLVMHPISGAHHAHRAAGGGFCTFNWLVGVVPALPEDVDVIVLDLDAHFGDGTAALIQRPEEQVAWADRLRVFDISGGFGLLARYKDRGRYVVTDVNDEIGYREALDKLEPRVREWVAEIRNEGRRPLVVYQAGMDPFEGDHVGSVKGMTGVELNARDRRVLTLCRALGVPVVTVLAGGYSQQCVDLHVQTFEAAADIYAREATNGQTIEQRGARAQRTVLPEPDDWEEVRRRVLAELFGDRGRGHRGDVGPGRPGVRGSSTGEDGGVGEREAGYGSVGVPVTEARLREFLRGR